MSDRTMKTPNQTNETKRRPVRVLVVDDSSFMQRRMTELLEGAGDISVVGTARDGADAIRRSAELLPDVITMDIHMPRMDGLLAIEHIMRTSPRPIVVVSSFVSSGSVAAIAALERGAIELVQKPSEGGISLDLAKVAAELIAKVRVASRVRVVRSGRAVTSQPLENRQLPSPPSEKEADVDAETVVLIGCSTGGPSALMYLARRWNGAQVPPMIVAQHLPSEFTKELARQMAEFSGIVVREATPGDRPRPGQILVSPGGRHLTLDAAGAVRLSPLLGDDHWVPSVDRLFESAATAYGARALGVVLTGMGNDGTVGAGVIRRAGGSVWAQDEASSIIDGMPRSVREAGYASRVLSLSEMGEAILCSATSSMPS